MFKSQRKIFKKAIVEPAVKNSPMVLFFLGLLLVGLTSYAPIATELWFPDIVKQLGWTILGAGVFTGIMKSAVFTEIFQNHLADVIYSPERSETQGGIVRNWRSLTSARIKELLPLNHEKVVSGIEGRFFDDELEYHFEGWWIRYDINVDEKGMATINNTMGANLLIPQNVEDPDFRQTVSSESGVQLTSVIIDNQSIDLNDPDIFVAKPDKGPNAKELVLPLRKYAKSGDKILFQRTFKVTQDLRVEPHITAVLTRYITGATVHARVSATHQVKFVPIGIHKVAAPYVDGEGYKSWRLAAPQDLLLPGQGYILVVVPVLSGNTEGGKK